MTKQTTPKRGITPPKGKPTRSRSGGYGRKRVFGPVSQWIAVTVLLIMAFVVLIILTGGGDFNPFNDQNGLGGTVVPAIRVSSASFA
jgi:hypothetical protein